MTGLCGGLAFHPGFTGVHALHLHSCRMPALGKRLLLLMSSDFTGAVRFEC